MIRISQLKLPVTHKKSDLEKKIYTTLKISSSDLLTWHIEKKSLDDSPQRKVYDWLDTDEGRRCIEKAGYVAVD